MGAQIGHSLQDFEALATGSSESSMDKLPSPEGLAHTAAMARALFLHISCTS